MRDWKLTFNTVSGTKGIQLYLHNDSIDCTIRVPNDKLSVFGFYVAGCELGIIGEYRTDNLDAQAIIKEQIVNSHIKMLEREIDYFSIKDFLQKEYKSKSKVEKDAVERVLSIIKENYNHIIRTKQKQLDEDNSKIKPIHEHQRIEK